MGQVSSDPSSWSLYGRNLALRQYVIIIIMPTRNMNLMCGETLSKQCHSPPSTGGECRTTVNAGEVNEHSGFWNNPELDMFNIQYVASVNTVKAPFADPGVQYIST